MPPATVGQHSLSAFLDFAPETHNNGEMWKKVLSRDNVDNHNLCRARQQAHHPDHHVMLPSEKQQSNESPTGRTNRTCKEREMKFIERNVIGNSVEFSTPFGTRKMTYADYTASGRSLQHIEDMIQRGVLPLYANTHTTSSRTGRQTSKFREDARNMIAASVNADKQKDVVLFCGSGSTAAIMKMLNKLRGCKAWEQDLRNGVKPLIIIGPHEHHSNILPWRESGAKVVQCREDSNTGTVDLAHLEEILKHNSNCKLKVGSFSAGSNVTGILCPTAAVAAVLHKHDALAFFDFAAAGPYIPIDMNPSAASPSSPTPSSGSFASTSTASSSYMDAIFLSPHKFVGGPQTPGVLVCKRELMHSSGVLDNEAPTVPGGGTVSFVSEADHRYVDVIEEREEGGTPDIVGAVRCGLVFRLKDEVSAEFIEECEHEYVRMAFEAWERHPRITILGSKTAQRLSILSFLITTPEKKLVHHNLICTLLNDLFGIQARSGCACAGPYVESLLGFSAADVKMLESVMLQGDGALKPGFTRLNLNFFLPRHTVQFILDAVSFLADHAWKLAPLYTCNPSNGEWTFRHPSALPPSLPSLLSLPSHLSSDPHAEASLESISLLLPSSSFSLPPSAAPSVTPDVTACYFSVATQLVTSLESLARSEGEGETRHLDFPVALDPSFVSPESASFQWFLLPSSALAFLLGAGHGRPLTGKVLPAEVFGRDQHPANAAATAHGETVFPRYLSKFELFAMQHQADAKRRLLAQGQSDTLGEEGARRALAEAQRRWREMPEDERARFGAHLPGEGLVALA
eukprot:CAMPEP_0181305364 /NCGR_PEP_ID=MMETSP1101-20121128/9686_1 /TAXON_ID=46948 /ORGANISM="Rhodomonas abbreviata, Strain Caron Lab Isolate" /LENGTH=799 /DNA_ID=CAMNT_0023411267 /DNA_START=151 /DNA_END=2546 /DNA_ORIENTATION=-